MENYLSNLKNYLKDILTIPSVTGSTFKITEYIKSNLEKKNISYTQTNKGNILITIKGADESLQYERLFSSHIDTLGAMVKEIKSNGTLSIVPIGGFMMNSVEGENCIIETDDLKTYEGTIQTIKPSVHISGSDARELKRTPENMEVVLDEKVFSKEDTEKLGINVGDFISFDPRFKITQNGFVKSRHLDDKASVSVLLTAIDYIIENNVTLPYTTHFLITNHEEVGHGAAASIPENTKEFIAVDMGAPGPSQNSSEYSVCICAKDSSGPYNLELKKKLVKLCVENSIDYKVDIYPYYGSDASCALSAGWDLKTALIGPGVFASHAYERTHLDAILNTLNLVINYAKSQK